MPVNLKELNLAPKGGIYALAPDIPANKNTTFSIKVGRTIDFKKRLNSYHLCFNAGFRVIALLPLKNSTPEEQRKSRTMQLEKLAGELLGKSRSYANRERRGSEWYDTTVPNIHRIFKEVHKNFKSGQYELTKAPIFQFDDNYINIFEVDVEKSIQVPMYVKSSDENKILLSKTAKTKKYPKPPKPPPPKKISKKKKKPVLAVYKKKKKRRGRA